MLSKKRMINAKEEFLKAVSGCPERVKWAIVWSPDENSDEYGARIDARIIVAALPQGYTDSEYQEFLAKLDFKYCNGYGLQRLHGYIGMADGTWFERAEYDGSEWWEYRSTPVCPPECRRGTGTAKH